MQWAELLARSASPFFISCADGSLEGEDFRQMKDLYRIASKAMDKTEPLDMEYNMYPSRYSINGKLRVFDWYDGEDGE